MSQDALVLESIGSPLVLRKRPIPTPEDGQVLVRNFSTGLIQLDPKARDRGLFVQGSLPRVLGFDILGIVVALGNNVTRFQVGDRVMGQADIFHGGPDAGGLQQYTILQERFSCKVPPGWADEEACTLPSNLSAAAIAFFSSSGSPLNIMNDAGGLGLPLPWSKEASSFGFPQKSILIIGAGAATGRFGIQLARILGFGTIIAVAGLRNETELRRMGVTHVLDRHAPDLTQQIQAIVKGGLLYAFDTSNYDHSVALEVLSGAGNVACLVATPPYGIPDEEKPRAKFIMGASHLHPELMGEFWERLPSYMSSSDIEPVGYRIVKGLDANAINAAFDTISSGEEQIKYQVMHAES